MISNSCIYFMYILVTQGVSYLLFEACGVFVSESELELVPLLSLKILFIFDLSTVADVAAIGVDVTALFLDVAFEETEEEFAEVEESVLALDPVASDETAAANFEGCTRGVERDFADGDGWEAGDNEAAAAASVAALLACLAFAAKVGSEKTSKSESENKIN